MQFRKVTEKQESKRKDEKSIGMYKRTVFSYFG